MDNSPAEYSVGSISTARKPPRRGSSKIGVGAKPVRGKTGHLPSKQTAQSRHAEAVASAGQERVPSAPPFISNWRQNSPAAVTEPGVDRGTGLPPKSSSLFQRSDCTGVAQAA